MSANFVKSESYFCRNLVVPNPRPSLINVKSANAPSPIPLAHAIFLFLANNAVEPSVSPMTFEMQFCVKPEK